MQDTKPKDKPIQKPLVEDIDYYFDNGLMVLTEHYLKHRGYCCGNGCRHCPFPDCEKPGLK